MVEARRDYPGGNGAAAGGGLQNVVFQLPLVLPRQGQQSMQLLPLSLLLLLTHPEDSGVGVGLEPALRFVHATISLLRGLHGEGTQSLNLLPQRRSLVLRKQQARWLLRSAR